MNVNTAEIKTDELQNKQIEQFIAPKVADNTKHSSGVHISSDMRSELTQLVLELNVKTPYVIDYLLKNREIKMKSKYINNPKKNCKVDVNNVNKAKLYELKDKYKLSSLEEVLWRLMNDYLV